jgi:hypothetical protein
MRKQIKKEKFRKRTIKKPGAVDPYNIKPI